MMHRKSVFLFARNCINLSQSIDKAASKGTIQAFKVEHMAPIHGDYVTWNDFVEDTITMTQYQPGQAPKPATGGTGGQ